MSRASLGTSRRRRREEEVGLQIARRVRDLRLARAVTQEELAAVLGVKRESMSRYESGERAITIALLIDIAAALEQPVTTFLPSSEGNGVTHGALDEVTAALQERPDLIPSVLDLLAVLREEPR